MQDITFDPMEAKLVPLLPTGKIWTYEPKWDGFRCLALKSEGKITLHSKSGKPLGRYFPDIVEMLGRVRADDFLFDGELVVPVAEQYLFSELQLRLHPSASRVKKLAEANPAHFIVFDLLALKGKSLRDEAFASRREKLEGFFAKFLAKEDRLILSPQTSSLTTAKGWVKKWGARIDGIVAKNMEIEYRPGEREMEKFKFIRTADCVVGGFRYGTDSGEVGSLLLGLYDDNGLLNHVGFTSALKNEDKKKLTAQLKRLISPPGFTGKAPGGPSRWSTARSEKWEPLKPLLVVEVTFDHVSDDRFRHGTGLVRWRPDKKPEQCTMIQLQQPKLIEN
ncbi:MAG: dependent ligase [Micavibrio sp.]|nr:dependent ligase [Micavibrio sp.]